MAASVEHSVIVDCPPLTPIGPMPGYSFTEADRRAWVRVLFDDTARDYDRVEKWLSLGTGAWYRRQSLSRAGLASGMSVADVATGTGLVAREASSLVGATGRVVGVDPSEGMMRAAPRTGSTAPIELRLGWAEELPLGDGEFDFVTMGYALRHIADLHAAFAEFARVLKPGGRVCILEVTKPSGRLGTLLLRTYMTAVSGVACRAIKASTRTRELWRYYWQTIQACIPPTDVLAALTAAGFENVSRHVELGVFSEFTATRSRCPGPAASRIPTFARPRVAE